MKISPHFLNKAPKEIDYLLLMDSLQEYKQPRNKITQLLKNGDLLRVKKGLYVINSSLNQNSYSREVLANLIYGPSAISFEYALAFYGIIPERVETITSVTHKRNKKFNTPIGTFTYTHTNIKKYIVGISLVSLGQKNIIIASPEKALSDCLSKISPFINTQELSAYLFENLRIDSTSLQKFNKQLLDNLCVAYNNVNVKLLKKICNQYA